MPKSFHLSLVIKGIITAAGIALVLSLLFSLLLSFTSIPESSQVLNVILGISVFSGAAWAAYKAGMKGLIYGLAVGIGFIIFLLLLFAVLAPGSPSWISFGEKAIITLAAGAIGGIIGVVFKR